MAGASPVATAQVVGNAFVNQYYNVLHQSPHVVHRFYTNASHLTRAEAGASGAVEMAHTQDQIHEKVMSSDYSEFKAEIKTVDSQDSLSGGVLVLVAGSLSTKSTGKRNFVQCFFLAPQEKGYFVLNDVFRYCDDEIPQQASSAPAIPTGVPEAGHVHQKAPEPVVEQPPPAPEPEVVREVTTPPPAPENEATAQEVFDDEGPTGAEEEEHVGPVPVVDTTTPVIEEPESPMVQTTPVREIHPLLQEPEPVGEAPKKSYASILKVLGAPPPPKVVQPVAERPAVQSSPAPPAVAAPTQDNQEDAAPAESEADGRSVYVKNLPMSITAHELEENFKSFGSVKENGVNVKSQKQGVCYAFVEFEDASAAQKAIQASPVEINGRQVYIEEKKPMGRAPRRTSDGRTDRPYRTDRNDRGEGARGRGSYGGRNPGRGAGPDNREQREGGRGGAPSRGGYANSNNGMAPGANRGGSERRSEGQRPPRRNPNGPAPTGPRSNGPPAVAAV